MIRWPYARLAAGVVAALLSVGLAAPPPTATRSQVPTTTPTWTPAPTQTARVVVVVATTAPTATPRPTPTPTPILQAGPGGATGSVCTADAFAVPIPLPLISGTICLPGKSLFAWGLRAVADLFTTSVDAIVRDVQAILTTDPNITAWADAQDLFTFCWGLGLGLAGTFYALAGLYWLKNSMRRDFEPLVPFQDAVLGGVGVGALPWLVPQWLGFCNSLSDQIARHIGTVSLTGMDRILANMVRTLTGDPSYAVVDLLVSLLLFLFALLLALVRFIGTYGEVWLYCVGPLAMATWILPPLREIATRWVAAFAAITLWAPAWAIGLKVFSAVGLDLPRSDPAFNSPLMIALAAVAGMVFLTFVPRLVDLVIGTGIAAASGAYVLFEGVIGGVVGGATAVLTQKSKGKGV